MDKTAFYQLSYGLYLLTAKTPSRENGCIVNTVIQCASEPLRLSVCVITKNLTCDMIRESGRFNVSVLPETTPFGLFRHYGMQSGRDVDKFAGDDATPRLARNGIRYLPFSPAVFACRVVSSEELGSHTLFIAEVEEAEVLSPNAPLTYADYQSRLKPKPAAKPADKKPKAWRCKICGYVYEGENLPADFSCPLCGHGPEDFEPVY